MLWNMNFSDPFTRFVNWDVDQNFSLFTQVLSNQHDFPFFMDAKEIVMQKWSYFSPFPFLKKSTLKTSNVILIILCLMKLCGFLKIAVQSNKDKL